MAKFHKAYGNCSGPLDFPMQDTEARELEQMLESGDWSPFKLQKGESLESILDGERSDVSVINTKPGS